MRVHWIGLGIAAVALTARAASAHTDEDLGYSMTVSGGWRAIPIASEEKYIVAKWQSEKEYFDKKEGWSGFRPELKVILFDPKAKKTAEVKDGAAGVKEISVNNPYKTFKEWVKSDTSGGRFISKEEEITVNGVATTWYEVAYEKLTVPRHGLAFVYHAEDIDYCVTTEVLEDSWKKLSPNLLSMLRSFKIFPRKGLVKRETTGDGPVTVHTGSSDVSPEERLKARQDAFERKLMLSIDRLTKGWSVKRSQNYVALTHADAKFTNLVLDQAEGIRQWADATLGFFGTGTPTSVVLRICKDDDEQRSFQDLSSRSGGWVRDEIILARNEAAWGLGNVASEIFDRWLQDKNPRLSYSLPPWLSRGIEEWVGSAYVKGGHLEFRPDADTLIALRLAAKQGTLISPRQMMAMSYEDLSKVDSPGDSFPGPMGPGMPPFLRMRSSGFQQSAGLVRYLLAGPGKTNALTKDLLHKYVENLDAIVKEKDETPSSAGEAFKAPQTEEEEEAQFKNRKSFWKDHQSDLIKSVFEKTFADWKESDWVSFEKSYRSYAN